MLSNHCSIRICREPHWIHREIQGQRRTDRKTRGGSGGGGGTLGGGSGGGGSCLKSIGGRFCFPLYQSGLETVTWRHVACAPALVGILTHIRWQNSDLAAVLQRPSTLWRASARSCELEASPAPSTSCEGRCRSQVDHRPRTQPSLSQSQTASYLCAASY